MIRLSWCVILLNFCHGLAAQTPPCGIAVIHLEKGGTTSGEAFLPATPEHVRFAVLRALPAFGAKLVKDDALHIEAKTDPDLDVTVQKSQSGKGHHGPILGAFGTFSIEIRPETRGEIKGSVLHVEFEKHGYRGSRAPDGYAKPLLDEIGCLSQSLGQDDPVRNPRGLELQTATSPKAILVPEDTPLKILLLDALYSKELENNSAGATVHFEVADDVVVDNVVVIRRGALATSHFTKAEKAKGYGRSAEMDFVFDTVTAVDGQQLRINGAGEKRRGSQVDNKVAVTSTVVMGPGAALGWAVKGNDVFIRAGTSYDLRVSGQPTVQTGK